MSKVYFGDTATGTLVFLVPVTMALPSTVVSVWLAFTSVLEMTTFAGKQVCKVCTPLMISSWVPMFPSSATQWVACTRTLDIRIHDQHLFEPFLLHVPACPVRLGKHY